MVKILITLVMVYWLSIPMSVNAQQLQVGAKVDNGYITIIQRSEYLGNFQVGSPINFEKVLEDTDYLYAQIDWGDYSFSWVKKGERYNFLHTYTEPGIYPITLNLTDRLGRLIAVERYVDVEEKVQYAHKLDVATFLIGVMGLRPFKLER
jgi:hypothetical protein